MNYLDLHMLTYLALAAQQQQRHELATREATTALSQAFLAWAEERGTTADYFACLEKTDKIECFWAICEVCEPFLVAYDATLAEQYGLDDDALVFAREALPYVFVRMPENGDLARLADEATQIFGELYRRTVCESELSKEDREYLKLYNEVMRPGNAAEISARFRRIAHGEKH